MRRLAAQRGNYSVDLISPMTIQPQCTLSIFTVEIVILVINKFVELIISYLRDPDV